MGTGWKLVGWRRYVKSCVEVVVVERRLGSVLLVGFAAGFGDAVLVLLPPREEEEVLSEGDRASASGSSTPSSNGPLVERRGIATLFLSS